MMKTNTATKPEIQRRFLQIENELIKDNELTMSVSSEYPVERGYGKEVLSHKKEAIDLTRFNDSAPILWSHDPQQQIGVIKRAYIEGKKLKVDMRFGNSEKAKEVMTDVSAGVIRNVSIGYSIEKEQEEEDYTLITRWTPLEASFVSVASDPTIGVQRSHPSIKSNSKVMPEQQLTPKTQEPEPIHALSNNWEERQYGEYQREANQFSIVNAIKAQATGDWSNAGREREVHQELSRQHGQRTATGILVPNQSWAKRTFVAGTASAGGNLIQTDVLQDQFIDALRPYSAVMEAGASMISGLVGNVSIPKRATSSTAEWIGADDSDALSESTGTFGTVSLSPRTIGVFSKFSRLMQLQSTPDVENLIRQDFLELIGTGIDSAAIEGTGSSNQPEGILSASGTTVLALGTNGAALTLDNLITLKKNVSASNADDASCCYLINSKVESALSQLKNSDGLYHLNPYELPLGEQRFAGRRMLVSNNVPSDLTKGSGSNLSAAIYGRFSDVLIGQWSGIEIETDIYSDFAKGTVGVRALATIDIAVRHGASFSLVKDAIAA